jgi:hypothetical protein
MKTMAVNANASEGLTFRQALSELRDFAIEEVLDKLEGSSAPCWNIFNVWQCFEGATWAKARRSRSDHRPKDLLWLDVRARLHE